MNLHKGSTQRHPEPLPSTMQALRACKMHEVLIPTNLLDGLSDEYQKDATTANVEATDVQVKRQHACQFPVIAGWVEIALPGHKLNGGRPRDRECDGTDSGELTEVTRDGGVSRAGFGRYAVGMLCLGQRGSW